jgi:hypothetical protein
MFSLHLHDLHQGNPARAAALSSAQQAPDGMSAERLTISRAFGAQVMTVGDFHVNAR